MAKKNFIDDGYLTYGNHQVGNIAELDSQFFAPPAYQYTPSPYFTKSPYQPYQPPYQAPYQPVPIFTKAPYSYQPPYQAPYQPPMYRPAYPVSTPSYGVAAPSFGIDYGQPVYSAPAQPVFVAPPYQPPMYSPAYPVSTPPYGGKLPTPEYNQTPSFGYQPIFSPVEPAPIYTAPVYEQPVYVAPTPEPIYVEPAPIYTAPVQTPVDEFVYPSQPVYVEPAAPTPAPVFIDETPTPAPSVPTNGGGGFVDEKAVPVVPAPDSTFNDDVAPVPNITNVLVTPSAPTASTSSNTLPVSKNLKPYVYAGLGIVVILIVARMVTKKD